MRALGLAFVLLLTGCAAGRASFLQIPENPVSWPPSQVQPSIQVLFVYHDSNDVRRKPGLWEQLRTLITGAPERRLVTPYGVCLNGKDELFVADTSSGVVHRLSLVTGQHSIFDGGEDFKLATPVGVACTPDGRFFVTDSALARVVVFAADGSPLFAFGSADEMGRPTGIAYDAAFDRLLIVDTTGGRLLVYDREGRLVSSTGERGGELGEFNYPTNVAVSADGRIFVMDSLNFRVQILSSALEPLSQFGTVGGGPGMFAKPKGIALDSDGHIYVADGMFDNIQVFDQEGRLLLTFGETGRAFGSLSLPTGMFFDSRNRLFVSDSGNSRVQVFEYLGGPR